MGVDSRRITRLVSLFLLGCLLLNYPLLSLFNMPRLVSGIPLIYAYIFLVWAIVIVLVGLTVRTEPTRKAPTPMGERNPEP